MDPFTTQSKKNLLALAITTIASVGCSFNRPFEEASKKIEEIPTKIETQDDLSNDIITNQVLSSSAFIIRRLNNTQFLPPRHISRLSVTDAGIYDVMQLLFDESNIAVTFEGGPDSIRRYGPVSVYNLKGDINDVMNHLANSVGFFWSYQNHTIMIEPEQQFVVDLPPILNDDNLAGITNTFQYLGARDSYLDRNSRSIVFRSNKKALKVIEDYLNQLRKSRSMVIYDLQILQVDLNDDSNLGIQWNQYNGSNAGNGGGNNISKMSKTEGDIGFSFTIVGRSFSSDLLLNFLRSQGTVKSLSKPRMGIMSGTKGALRVGKTTTIVAKIGRDIGNTVSQTTVETKDVKTGLDLNLFAEEHDKTIYTRINLSITEILKLSKFTALGTDLTLPDIADREMRTQVRCRPGDTILLGGITFNKAEVNRSIGAAINEKKESAGQSELVIVIRPRLVYFEPKEIQKTQAQESTKHIEKISAITFEKNLKEKTINDVDVYAPTVIVPYVQGVQANQEAIVLNSSTLTPATPMEQIYQDISIPNQAKKTPVIPKATKQKNFNIAPGVPIPLFGTLHFSSKDTSNNKQTSEYKEGKNI